MLKDDELCWSDLLIAGSVPAGVWEGGAIVKLTEQWHTISMPRELVWLENSTFAAWGCEGCGWIIPNPRSASSDAPSAAVKEAFNKHECQKHPPKTNQT
jgi:hypothetical protein